MQQDQLGIGEESSSMTFLVHSRILVLLSAQQKTIPDRKSHIISPTTLPGTTNRKKNTSCTQKTQSTPTSPPNVQIACLQTLGALTQIRGKQEET